jgi:hypothetical protein
MNEQNTIPTAPVKPIISKPVLLSKEHDISAFVSTDETRYALTGIHYDAEHKRLEATDGRMLIRVPLEGKNDVNDVDEFPPVRGAALLGAPPSCTFPVKSFLGALSHLLQRVTLPVLSKVLFGGGSDQVMPLSFTTTDLDVEHTVRSKVIIDAAWPELDRVVPTREPKAVVHLSSVLLGKVCHYAQAVDTGKGVSLKLELSGNSHDPVRITMTTPEGRDVLVVMMPIRVS